MRRIDYPEARRGVQIAEVLELIAYQPRRVLGVHVRGPCPLHRGRTATSRVFAVHLSKNVYHCFACGASGNTLDLWAAWTRQSLYAAVVDPYQRLGREVPWLPCCRGMRAAAGSASPNRISEETNPMPDP